MVVNKKRLISANRFSLTFRIELLFWGPRRVERLAIVVFLYDGRNHDHMKRNAQREIFFFFSRMANSRRPFVLNGQRWFKIKRLTIFFFQAGNVRFSPQRRRTSYKWVGIEMTRDFSNFYSWRLSRKKNLSTIVC